LRAPGLKAFTFTTRIEEYNRLTEYYRYAVSSPSALEMIPRFGVLEEIKLVQLLKKFSASYKTQNAITLFIRSCY
jgi:hypothetical protein